MGRRVSFAVGLSINAYAYAACAASAAWMLGCAHPEAASDRHFKEMREEVTRMQADHDRSDRRLGALEVATPDEKSVPNEPPSSSSSTSKMGAAQAGPAGRVVQLGDPSDGDGADPNDPESRPDIRVTGAAGSLSASRGRAGKSSLRSRTESRTEDPELPSVRPEGSRSSVLDPDAKVAYELALAQVQAKQFERGRSGLDAFLARWPDHPYAENAIYWRGEALYGQGEYLRAAEQFEAVLARNGLGKKGPDALLKLGMCHDRLGSSQRAHEYWDRLKTEFPRSDAARKIPTGGRETSPSSPKGPKENR